MTSEESARNVYLLLMIVNKVAIVSHDENSWVIFLERFPENKETNESFLSSKAQK